MLLMRSYLRDHADGKSANQIMSKAKEFSLSARNSFALQDILLELCGNNISYSPPDKADHVYFEILHDEKQPDRLKIISHGVINETKWLNLSKKIEFVSGKNQEELFQIRNELIWAQSGINQFSPTQKEFMSTSYDSKGASAGTLTIAALAQGELSLERGESLGDVFQFTLKIDFMLEEPFRYNPKIDPSLSVPSAAS